MGYKLRQVLVDVPPTVDTPPTENGFGSYPGLPTSLCPFLSALVVPDAQFTLTGYRGDSTPSDVPGVMRHSYTLVLQSSSLVVMGRMLTQGLSALNEGQVYITSIEFDVRTSTDVIRHVVSCSSITATLNCRIFSPQAPFPVSFSVDGRHLSDAIADVALPYYPSLEVPV